jgi:hypothetical protein
LVLDSPPHFQGLDDSKLDDKNAISTFELRYPPIANEDDNRSSTNTNE